MHVKRKQNEASKSKRFILFYAEDKGVVKGEGRKTEQGGVVQRGGGGSSSGESIMCTSHKTQNIIKGNLTINFVAKADFDL